MDSPPDLLDSPPDVLPDRSQPESRSARGLFFGSRPRPAEEPEEELESPLHLVETESGGAAGSDSDPGWSDDLEWSDEPPTSSDTSPASEKPAQLLSKGQMRKTAETAVKVGTGMAHTVAAKTEAQKHVGLYLADDEDAVNIGHPLADIAYRRGDLVGGKLSPDANDFLRSMMGVAGYLAKQIAKIGAVRQIEEARHAQGMTDVGGA